MAGVLLLHGIGASAVTMRPIELALRHAGYATLNLTYPSRRHSLQQIAQGLAPQMAEFAAGLDGPLHIVTHSMGGLVARVLIAQNRPENLGRVVMLAPPNAGSEIADLLRGQWWFRQLLGPAGGQLATRRDSALSEALGQTNFELGIIAANKSISLTGSMLLPRPNDGRVSVASTRDALAADHITLPAAHTTILLSPRAIAQVLAFLRDGQFDHQARGFQWTKRATTSR
jgi:pimeloyl-ACP methyl ester carboxylesterase